MEVVHGIRADFLPGAAVTMGMFDGVHRGHQALLRACRLHADRLGLPAVALTYEPHPFQVLHPEAEAHLLTLLPEKVELLERFGMDYVLVAEFTLDFSRLTPEAFVQSVVVDTVHPRVVVVGYRSSFGHDRAGSSSLLVELGARLVFAVEVVEPVLVQGEPASSSRIRQCLLEGDLALATAMLGSPYRLKGRVVAGDGRGRQVGFPTANLDVPPGKLAPADGVYAVNVTVGGRAYRGAMSIGPRPTFRRARTLEVHLLDFAGELTAQTVTVEFLARLRGIVGFTNSDELTAQVREDIARVRALPPTG